MHPILERSPRAVDLIFRSPFSVSPKGKPGWVGSPHAAKAAAPPTRGISNRSAKIPLVHPPFLKTGRCVVICAYCHLWEVALTERSDARLGTSSLNG